MDTYLPVQYFKNEDLTNGSGANLVAVRNDFYIFKFWLDYLGREDTPFFTESKSTKPVYIENKATHRKMPKTGYKSAGAALQALCP